MQIHNNLVEYCCLAGLLVDITSVVNSCISILDRVAGQSIVFPGSFACLCFMCTSMCFYSFSYSYQFTVELVAMINERQRILMALELAQ